MFCVTEEGVAVPEASAPDEDLEDESSGGDDMPVVTCTPVLYEC